MQHSTANIQNIDSAAAQGFRMPGEFEPHDGCWMLWPQRGDVWRLNAQPAQHAFVEVANAISLSETVTVAVSDQQYDTARGMLPKHIKVIEISSDDAWMRDVGPSFLVNSKGELGAVDWKFNAWGGHNGGLYPDWAKDSRVAQKVCTLTSANRFEAPLVLEGGSIHVDGQGTLITTRECLLNSNRNPELSQQQIEQLLKEYLSVETVIWLDQGTIDDETDGHVDNLCCFIEPGVVALHWCDDPEDPQHQISKAAIDVLTNSIDAQGRQIKVVKLPHPGPLFITQEEALGIETAPGSQPREAGQRLAGSYANFYIGNKHVVFPKLDPTQDDRAAAVLAEHFPGREIIGVSAREILLGGGNIHCITQQQPAV